MEVAGATSAYATCSTPHFLSQTSFDNTGPLSQNSIHTWSARMYTADFGDNPSIFRNMAAHLELTAGTITSHPKKIPQAFKEFFCKPQGNKGEDHVEDFNDSMGPPIPPQNVSKRD